MTMHNSDREKQDQRLTSGMDDTATTIEFLRARLLAERSVSKSARQRADELAKRVTALEEQLQIETLHRQKAEKATADILAILENNRVSDVSEDFDSSSDQESDFDSKGGNSSAKENSVSSKSRTNDAGDFSGSELGSSTSQKNLRWKGRRNSLNSAEKFKDSYLRRRSSFASVSSSSSPKHHVGKSCRQIRRRESRSVAEEQKMGPEITDSKESREATSSGFVYKHSNGGPELLGGGSEAQQEKCRSEGFDSGCRDNKKNVTQSNSNFNGYGREKDMEKALEDQAQLIGRYEEMEKAQREWEERFRESNSSSPESCDPGNQSDVTEERDETKAHPQHPDMAVSSQVQEAKSDKEHVQKSSDHQPSSCNDDTQRSGDQKGSKTSISESSAQESASPMATGALLQGRYENGHYQPPHGSYYTKLLGEASHHVMLSTGISLDKGEASGSKNEPYALVPHEVSKSPSGVLEALKQAKLSLQQQINISPRTESGSRKVAERVDIPVGCPGLFRLPTDFAINDESKSNFLISGSRPTLPNFYPYTGREATLDDRVFPTSFADTPRSTFSSSLATRDHPSVSWPPTDITRLSYATNESRSRLSTQNPLFDFNSSTGIMPSSRVSAQPSYPTVPSFPDAMQRIPSNEMFSTSRAVGMPSNNNQFGMPPNDQLSFPDDYNTRPYMYR